MWISCTSTWLCHSDSSVSSTSSWQYKCCQVLPIPRYIQCTYGLQTIPVFTVVLNHGWSVCGCRTPGAKPMCHLTLQYINAPKTVKHRQPGDWLKPQRTQSLVWFRWLWLDHARPSLIYLAGPRVEDPMSQNSTVTLSYRWIYRPMPLQL